MKTIPILALLVVPPLAGACRAAPGASDSAASTATAAAIAAPDLGPALDSIAGRVDGTVTVSALHLGTGARLRRRSDTPVFMSSVVKLPLAVQVLARVDRGELWLDDTVAIARHELRVGPPGLATRHPNGGIRLTVRELLSHAVVDSDNTASDALLRHSGGAARVTAELSELGLAGIRVDRSYGENTWAFGGVTSPPAAATWTPARFRSLTAAVPPDERLAAARAFLADARDRATADAMAALLERLARGTILSDSSRALLLDLMTNSRNPNGRIVAGAPPGARVAHKTGTWDTEGLSVAVNDVGIVTLPDGRGQVVLAVMIAGSTRPVPEQEAVIADVTRLVTTRW